MDVQKCYGFLFTILYPQWLKCPKCQCSVQDSKIQRRDRAPILIYEVKTGIFITSLQKRFGRGLIINVRSLFVFYRVSLKAYRLYIYHKNWLETASIYLSVAISSRTLWMKPAFEFRYQIRCRRSMKCIKMQVKKCQAYRSEWSAASPWQQNSRPWYLGFWSPSGSGYHWQGKWSNSIGS